MLKPFIAGAAVALASATFHVHALAPSAVSPPAWVARSDEAAKILLDADARFAPEDASDLGAAQYDALVMDFKPDASLRRKQALLQARAKFAQRLQKESDPNMRQDLAILTGQVDLEVEGLDLDEKYMLPFADIGQLIFNGEFVLLKDEVAPERRPAALQRLKCYVGMAPGCMPITGLAKAQTMAKIGNSHLVGPYKTAVEQQLSKTAHYVNGIRDLFAKNHMDGADQALDKLDEQMKDYDGWVRSTVLPRSRSDFRLPEAEYAYHLKMVGLDIDPRELIKQAMLEFAETRSQMQVMAPVVAKAEGIPATNYRQVLKALKEKQLDKSSVLPTYRQVIAKIEDTIRKQGIVSLPKRGMVVRVASDAENASISAPHMDPPAFIGNKGERGTFVLATARQGGDGAKESYDDFTYEAAAWTLTAHEGRPGHELQFAGMIEHGVSLARSMFAFNSVNAEGWALYSEMEMLPYEPPAAQFVALQFRLLRAARAFLDPMLNLGLISRERAMEVLTKDAGFSDALARQELDRYTFEYPGQATAYFYGYSKIMQLRQETEIALGPNFNRKAFNDFLISQGMLPPAQIADAVRTVFIPSQARH
ncbi:DUF885 domain-containing protein [Pinirhizobacter soli]|uniref:DUF885 domain-containing protein n=1 Tax=Pinirhizobacter soli TaxID=2786953 RepID=UPI00202A34FC|nr:DUF885 domain-containing protein [Pinirhizobacter soli]